MTEEHLHGGKIHIDYDFEEKVTMDNEVMHGVRLEVNVLKDISVEEASQVLLQSYMSIASKVLEKHIVSGCTGCHACEIHEKVLKGIDRAYGDTPPY